jgi:hypothetical protein
MRYTTFFALSIILISCSGKIDDPQKIINLAIDKAGGEKFLQSRIEFDFRGRHYVSSRNQGVFVYERILIDKQDTIHDYLTNETFYREINNKRVQLADTMAAKYTRSVNSVIYFALLPYGLNDPAVHKAFIGETELDGNHYYKIKITFSEDGGGEDFEDVFHYWINQKTFLVDYFSYIYQTDGGGIRFRKAVKQHRIGGILLQDYINYQPVDNTKLDDLEELYTAGKLEELSRIELKNIKVTTPSGL